MAEMTEAIHTSNLICTKGGLMPSERTGCPGCGCHRVCVLKRMLWFGFVTTTTLTTQRCFGYCCGAFSFSTLSPTANRQRMSTKPGVANPNWLYSMPCSTRKNTRRAFWGMQSGISCRLAPHQSSFGSGE